jgi:RimJ/RimL family protein N-acetyltransferase
VTIRNLDALFRPQRVLWLGPPQSPGQKAVLDKIRVSGVHLEEAEEVTAFSPVPGGERTMAVVVRDADAQPAVVQRLGELGCRALVWVLHDPPSASILEAARERTLRILGPRSVGLSHASGFDASMLPQKTAPGSLALIAQSQTVAAAAVDWAVGRRVGFAWVAVTGGEIDVDVADLLDYAALDDNVRSVAVEVGRIRGARKFMSAARACARAKPTVILQTRLADRAAAGADPVRSACFARAGLVEVPNLPGLFDALASLQRLPTLAQPRVVVVANGAALCALGVDAVLRNGLTIVEWTEALQRSLTARLPSARFRPGAVDIGDPAIEDIVATLQLVLRSAGAEVVIYVRSPVAGHPHDPVAQALGAAKLGPRVLTAWLGLESAISARRLSAEAGQSTFTSPDAAARSIRYRWEHTRNRELLTQTPPRLRPSRLDPQRVHERLLDQLGAGTDARPEAAVELLRAYGIDSQSRIKPGSLVLRVTLERHPELGMYLSLRPDVRGVVTATAYAFVPLDGLLAGRLIAEAGLEVGPHLEARCVEAAQALLVSLSQIPMDQAHIEGMNLRVVIHEGRARVASSDARLLLTPGPVTERERLALAPYPATLGQRIRLGDGSELALRPVRPEDEPAVVELLQGLDQETVRLRFFAHIRHFSHTMAARMTQIDYDRELALVAHPFDAPESLRAIGTLIADPDNATGEFAILVRPDHARLGLGRQMLIALIEHARRRGIGCVWGVVLADNEAMLALARSLGFVRRLDPEDAGCRRVELHLGAPA